MRQRMRINERGKCPGPSRATAAAARGARTLALAALAGLAGCANEPSFQHGDAIGNPKLARAHLQAMADTGPVPLELHDVPAALGQSGAAAAAARGVPFMKLTFRPVEPGSVTGARLVLWFGGPTIPADVCEGEGGTEGPATRLATVWCEGAEPVAGLVGQAAGDTLEPLQRLIWESSGRLFPDTYIQDTGVDMWGLKVRPGASIGF